jgi:hypothetical protein
MLFVWAVCGVVADVSHSHSLLNPPNYPSSREQQHLFSELVHLFGAKGELLPSALQAPFHDNILVFEDSVWYSAPWYQHIFFKQLVEV